MTAILLSLYHAAAMLWETFWALVLGFSISAGFQVYVSKEQMGRMFGRAGAREMALATFFGAASSSCSYAATAAGNAAFRKGAAFVPVLAFMFASTNLVVELGAVLWILMGWQFVLAETVGAVVLILFLWLFASFTLPARWVEEARSRAPEQAHGCCHGHGGEEAEEKAPEPEEESGGCRHSHAMEAPSRRRFAAMASSFVMDWSMLWKEIVIGFLIAGFLMVLVPSQWWGALFATRGPRPVRLVENCLVGPLIAMASFVCSIGNIPMASMFWSNGISFGGVVSFIYADLIIFPLIAIYRKYYGAKLATYMTGLFFVCMALSGIVVDLLFTALHLVPQGPRPFMPMEQAAFSWNYTTWLNLAAIAWGGWLFWTHSHRANAEGQANASEAEIHSA